MTGLIVRRLVQLPLILAVIYTLTLLLAWALPGNPIEWPHEGRRPAPEIVEAMKAQYNLDSFPRFYFSYLSNATGLTWLREEISGEAARRESEAAERGVAPPSRRVFDLGATFGRRSFIWSRRRRRG